LIPAVVALQQLRPFVAQAAKNPLSLGAPFGMMQAASHKSGIQE
jgi:hypothetical protein